MKNSASGIQTTHVGSLPRPDDVIELAGRRQAGEAVDPAASQARLAEATAEVVRLQQRAGISIPGDGEFGKEMGQRINYGAWWSYSFQRMGGVKLGTELYRLPPKRSTHDHITLTSSAIAGIAPCSPPRITIRSRAYHPTAAVRA